MPTIRTASVTDNPMVKSNVIRTYSVLYLAWKREGEGERMYRVCRQKRVK